MSEEDLEVLITLDDPGEDDLEEDTFHHSEAGNNVAYGSGQPFPTRGDKASKQKSRRIMISPGWMGDKLGSSAERFP